MAQASVTHDSMTVESNHATEAEIRAAFELPEQASELEEPVVPETAAENDAEAQAKSDAETEKPKIDKRTREGRKASIQAEIDELTAAKHATRREIDEAKAELTRLKAELAAGSAPKAEVKPAVEPSRPKPTPDQFATYEDFVDARSEWNAEQKWNALEAERKSREQQAAAETSAKERAQQITTREQAYRATHPDYDEGIRWIAEAAQKGEPWTRALMPGSPMGDYLGDSDSGPALFHHLATHRDDLQRLLTLHPIRVIGEMGKLEARLEAASSGPAKAPAASTAKPPIKPVGGSPVAPSDDEPSDDEPVEAFIRRENARERKSRR